MHDNHRPEAHRSHVEIEVEKLNQQIEILRKGMKDGDLLIANTVDDAIGGLITRIDALEAGDRHLTTLVAQGIHNISLVALQVAGLVELDLDGSGKISTRVLSEKERESSGPPVRWLPSKVSTQHGDGGIPLAWVFMSPAPFNDVEIVCSPDAAAPIGIRCYGERKLPGNERTKFSLTWTEQR